MQLLYKLIKRKPKHMQKVLFTPSVALNIGFGVTVVPSSFLANIEKEVE